MLRPREGHDLRLLFSQLDVWPAATMSWTNDVFGNAVATARFSELTKQLTIESLAVVELRRSSTAGRSVAVRAAGVRIPLMKVT